MSLATCLLVYLSTCLLVYLLTYVPRYHKTKEPLHGQDKYCTPQRHARFFAA